MSKLHQRQKDGVFRAFRIADPSKYAGGLFAHQQICRALLQAQSGHTVAQMSWWKTLDAALESAMEGFDPDLALVQRVSVDLPFFDAFERGQDQWLDQAWLYWREARNVQTHVSPALSGISLDNQLFELLSASGAWQRFGDADCFERIPVAGAFDVSLAAIEPSGLTYRLHVHAIQDTNGVPWTIVRNRMGERPHLPLHAPILFQNLADLLSDRITDFSGHRVGLTFEDTEGCRVAEVCRPSRSWSRHLLGRAQLAWRAYLMGSTDGEGLLHAAGLSTLLKGAKRFRYE